MWDDGQPEDGWGSRAVLFLLENPIRRDIIISK